MIGLTFVTACRSSLREEFDNSKSSRLSYLVEKRFIVLVVDNLSYIININS